MSGRKGMEEEGRRKGGREEGRREHCINSERTEQIPTIDSRYNFGAGRKIDRPKNLHGVRMENTPDICFPLFCALNIVRVMLDRQS